MSWGVNVRQKSRDEFFTAADESFDQYYSEAHDEVKAQFEAAKECADRALGVLNGEYFTCSMGGHSHNADPGSLPDSLNISLLAVSAPTT